MKKFRVVKYETVVFAYEVIALNKERALHLVESKKLSKDKKFLSGRVLKEKYKIKEVKKDGTNITG